MGIQNLLNFLKPALLNAHISQFRGKRAAVDAMSWLYKGCYSCAMEINTDINTHDFLFFIQKMISMLQEYEVIPVLVFDGRRLKAKQRTEEQRKKLKNENLAKAKQLTEEGNLQEAKKFHQRSLKITKQMLYVTFDVLKKLNIEYMVAPYEADAQVAYLCKSGNCDLAITEDSDLICYLCPWILFKLQMDGNCQQYIILDLILIRELKLKELRESKQYRKELIIEKQADVRLFFAFQDDQLIDVCILSGCDYLPSIKGVGIKRAVELMHSQGSLYHIVGKLKNDSKNQDRLPKDYYAVVQRIRLIFKFQVVYETKEKRQCFLNEDEFKTFKKKMEEQENQNPELEDININQSIVGEILDQNLAFKFACGDLDLKTLGQREKVSVDFKKLFIKYKKKMNYQKQMQPQIQHTTNNYSSYQNEKDKSTANQTILSNMETFNQTPIQMPRLGRNSDVWADGGFSDQQTYEKDKTDIDDLMSLCDELMRDFQSTQKKIPVEDNDNDNEELFQQLNEHVISLPKRQQPITNIFQSSNPFQNSDVAKKSFSSIGQLDENDVVFKQVTKPKSVISSIQNEGQQPSLANFFKKSVH